MNEFRTLPFHLFRTHGGKKKEVDHLTVGEMILPRISSNGLGGPMSIKLQTNSFSIVLQIKKNLKH